MWIMAFDHFDRFQTTGEDGKCENFHWTIFSSEMFSIHSEYTIYFVRENKKIRLFYSVKQKNDDIHKCAFMFDSYCIDEF